MSAKLCLQMRSHFDVPGEQKFGGEAVQPITKSFMDLRQMKPLTRSALPAVPAALQIKPQLSSIHRAGVAWPPSASPASPAFTLPSPVAFHTRKPVSSCPHMPQAHSGLRALAHATASAQNSLPAGKTVSGLSSVCWLFGKASAASQTCLFYALSTPSASVSQHRVHLTSPKAAGSKFS